MDTETGSPVGTPRAVSPAQAVLDNPGESARKYLSVCFGFSNLIFFFVSLIKRIMYFTIQNFLTFRKVTLNIISIK